MGAALDARDKGGRGPLHFAAAHGHAEVARFLWSRGAEIDAESPGERGRLGSLVLADTSSVGAAGGAFALPHHLLNAPRPPAAVDGRTPLHLACLGGHTSVATLLLQKGAWAEAYDSGDDTPLHLAAR